MAAEAKIGALIKAADVSMEPLWPGLLAKALASVKLEASSAPGVEDIGLVQPLGASPTGSSAPSGGEESGSWKEASKGSGNMGLVVLTKTSLLIYSIKKTKAVLLCFVFKLCGNKGMWSFAIFITVSVNWETRGSISKFLVSLNKGFRNRFGSPGQSY